MSRSALISRPNVGVVQAPDFETVAIRLGGGTPNDSHIKSVALLVFEAAEAGDALAQPFIYKQGYELGLAGKAIPRKRDLTQEDVDVVLGGSLFYGKGDLLMSTVREVILADSPDANIKRLDAPPVVGAVLPAANSVGVGLPPNLVAGLLLTMQVPSMFWFCFDCQHQQTHRRIVALWRLILSRLYKDYIFSQSKGNISPTGQCRLALAGFVICYGHRVIRAACYRFVLARPDN